LTFGERLKELRNDAGLTQEQLGEKIGLKRRMVQYLEANGREPNLAAIHRLCEIFDCTADHLLGREDRNERTQYR
jgi:transcriptional regulator with XRE-family HTH domain